MVRCHISLLPMNSHWQQDYAQARPLWVEPCPLCCGNVRTLFAKSAALCRALTLDGSLDLRSPMSLRLQQPAPRVPGDTARIARAAFPHGNPYLLLRDRLGP